jgi:hypothetical protein
MENFTDRVIIDEKEKNVIAQALNVILDVKY